MNLEFYLVIAILLCVEIGSRFLQKINPAWTQERQQLAAYILERTKSHVFIPGLGFVLKPRIHQQMTVNWTMSERFNFTYDTVELGKEGVGIRNFTVLGNPYGVVIGNSFVEGWGMESVDTLVRNLEIPLRHFLVNLGQEGFTTNQYLSMLERWNKYHEPKLVIVCIFEHDFADRLLVKDLSRLTEPTGMWRINNPIRYANVWMMKNSFTYAMLREIHIKFVGNPNSPSDQAPPTMRAEPVHVTDQNLDLELPTMVLMDTGQVTSYDWRTPEWKEAVDLVEGDLVQIKAEARQAKLLCVYIPSKEQVYLGRMTRKVSPHMDDPNRELKRMCAAHQIKFFDLTPAFRRESTRQLYFKTDPHWNVEGNQLAADEIAKALK